MDKIILSTLTLSLILGLKLPCPSYVINSKDLNLAGEKRNSTNFKLSPDALSYGLSGSSQTSTNFSLQPGFINKSLAPSPATPSIPEDQGVYSTTSTLTFAWAQPSQDPSIIAYYLEIGTSISSGNIFSGEIGNTSSYTVYNCIDGLTYYARVKAKNNNQVFSAWSGWSDGITVDISPPIVSGISSPTHPEISDNYADRNPVFEVNGLDPVSGVAGYYYMFSQSSSTTITVNNSTFSLTNSFRFTNLEDGFWYLYIISKDNAGNINTVPSYRKISIKTRINPGILEIFKLADGTEIHFSSNTLESQNRILISSIASSNVPGYIYDENLKFSNIIKEIKLENISATIKGKIKVLLSYGISDISGLEENNLKMAYYDETINIWQIITNSYPDKVAKKVISETTHLSLFRIAQYSNPTTQISGISNYPNPFAAKNELTKIRYTLKEENPVIIKILNLTGIFVIEKTIERGKNPGGLAGINEIEWDGKDKNGNYVSAGGYICLIKSGEDIKKIKIGVK